MPEDGKLKSEMIVKDNRRYYLDLKENSRGRFLRVSYCLECYCYGFMNDVPQFVLKNETSWTWWDSERHFPFPFGMKVFSKLFRMGPSLNTSYGTPCTCISKIK